MKHSDAISARGRRLLLAMIPAGLLIASWAGAQTTAPAASTPIVIDGAFDDWEKVPVATADGLDARNAEIDFGEVRVAHDGRFLHLLVYIAHEVNLQRLDGRAELLVDADGDPATGEPRDGLAGVDLVVTFSPPNRRDPNRPGMGVGARAWSDGRWHEVNPYDLGVTFAPTYASRQIELRIERAPDAPLLRGVLAGPHCAMKLVLTDGDAKLVDETEPVTHRLEAVAPAAPRPTAPATIARPPGTDVRVVSWNTRYGALVQQPDLARRVLSALDPDVVLLQEQTDADTARDIARVLNGDGPARYRALVGAGGGDLRSAIVARVPLERIDAIEPIPYPYWEGRFLRACGAAVQIAGRRLLLVSVHLKCCGRIGDRSDEKRENEAQAIRAAVREAQRRHAVDGVVVGGDLNLVGGRRPLAILRDSIDTNGSDLAIAAPMQLDGRSNATWMDTEQPFVAGRLDYVLFSDSALESLGSFVFDSGDLAEDARRRLGLEASDATTVSDHLPVVVDLKWREPDGLRGGR